MAKNNYRVTLTVTDKEDVDGPSGGNDPMHIISLGAGVQSSTMALMAAKGEITPMPEAAIFADTQAEPQSVYEWLDWLETRLPFPVYRVTNGNLREAALEVRTSAKGNKYFKTKIPWHTINKDGSHGFINMRNCTADFKIKPIRKKVKKLAGIRRGEKEIKVVQWLGISVDEAHRMRDSRDEWQTNYYPLVDMRMSRTDCLNWMHEQNYPEPPRSSCVFCGFHSQTEWRRLKTDEPDAFADACKFEQEAQGAQEAQGIDLAKVFLTKWRKPLAEIDFTDDQQRLFGNECEGVCGV